MATSYEPTTIFGNLEVIANLDDSVEHGTGDMKIGDTCTVLSNLDPGTNTGNALQITGSIGTTTGGLNINGVSNLDRTNIVTDDATSGNIGFDVSGLAKISLATSDTAQNDAILLNVTAANSGIDINTGAGSGGVGFTVDSAIGASNTASGAFVFSTGNGGLGSSANAGKSGNIILDTGNGGLGDTSFNGGNAGDITLNIGTGGSGAAGVNGGNSGSFIVNTAVGGITGSGVAGTDGFVDINTVGAFTVDVSAAGASIDAVGVSNFTTTGSNNTLTLQATNSTGGQVIINGGSAATSAVIIAATDLAGGIFIDSGSNGINIDSVDGNIEIDTIVSAGSGGTISLDSNVTGGTGNSNFTHTSDAATNDLIISVVSGGNDSSIIVNSDGTGSDAISILTTGTGDIKIDATNVNSVVGAINIDSRATASSWTHTTTADSQGDLTISTSGAFDSDLILQAGGDTSTALQILAPIDAGSIKIDSSNNGANTGGIDIDSRAIASTWTQSATGAAQDLTISMVGVFDSSLILSSEGTASDAISIFSADAAGEFGGINIDFGSTGLDIDSVGGLDGSAGTASGGMTINTGVGGNGSATTGASSGGMTLQTGTGGVATGANTSGDSGDITLTGGSGGASSGGTGTAGDGGTVQINSGIAGSAGGGTPGAGGDIDFNSSNDILADATNSISLDSGAVSNFTVTGSADLTINSTAGSTIVEGGEGVADAVYIHSTDANGGINIDAGSGGVLLETAIGETGATSGNINSSTGVGGAGDGAGGGAGASGSSTFESSDGGAGTGGNDAGGDSGIVTVQTGTGGVADGAGISGDGGDLSIIAGTGGASSGASGTGGDGGDVSIQPGVAGVANGGTVGTIGSVNIGTLVNGSPISIGHATSEVTVNDNLTVTGDLTVSGTTTTINTQTLEIDDNIILINSAGGAIGEDTGTIVRRYQIADPTGAGGSGDVVLDTGTNCAFTGIAVTVGTTTTITLTATPAVQRIDQTGTIVPFSGQLDFLSGWWFQVTTASGITNVNAVHRIKSSTAATNPVCTIYAAADGGVEGADLIGNADASDIITLFSCPYVGDLYNESQEEWQLAYTATEPTLSGSTITVQRFADLHVANLTAATINNNTPDSIVTVTLVDNAQGVGSSVAIGSTLDRGAYLIIVEGADTTDEAMGVWSIAAPSDADEGAVQRLVHVRGSSGERINIHWPASSSPKLYYTTSPGGGGANRDYSVKIIGV